MLTFLAPAKINLTLEVLAKRPDAYHEIRSVIQTMNLCDRLDFEPAEKVIVRCDDSGWKVGQSLVSRAAALLKENSGYARGATIELSKKIPLLSGFGGDSSDAATVLRGLNKLWGLGLAPGEIARLATQLGSDVPFFLFGGTALLQGRGETVCPLPSLPRMWLVLLIPPLPRSAGKTGRLYATLKKKHYTEGRRTEELIALLTKGGNINSANLFNVFEKTAFNSYEGLDGYRKKLLKAGATKVHLAGSGPALFVILKEKAEAEKIHRSLKEQGLEVYLTETLGGIEPQAGK